MLIMSLVNCPECGNQISDRAVMCPKCGLGTGMASVRCFGYEYRSEARVFGLPLVHIASGYDPAKLYTATYLVSDRGQAGASSITSVSVLKMISARIIKSAI